LLRANAAFQAIVIPAGSHEIVFAYRDYLFWIGLAISVAALAISVVTWIRTKASREQSAPVVVDDISEPLAEVAIR
jgi:uncharacterized membrane protein YfhO